MAKNGTMKLLMYPSSTPHAHLLLSELDLVWVHLYKRADDSFLAFAIHGLHHENWTLPRFRDDVVWKANAT